MRYTGFKRLGGGSSLLYYYFLLALVVFLLSSWFSKKLHTLHHFLQHWQCTVDSLPLYLSLLFLSLSLPLLSQDGRRICLFFSILTFPGQAPLLLLGQANWSIRRPGGLLYGHADMHTQRAVPRPSATLINKQTHKAEHAQRSYLPIYEYKHTHLLTIQLIIKATANISICMKKSPTLTKVTKRAHWLVSRARIYKTSSSWLLFCQILRCMKTPPLL